MTSLRVLVLVQGALGDRLTGPEIRAWEMAKAFARDHRVTAAASVAEPHEREGIRVVPRTRRRMAAEALRHDVVIGPVIPPFAQIAMGPRRCLRVADLYDPVDLEVGMLGSGWRARRSVARQRAGQRLQLRWSDLVLCANERQHERIAEQMRLVDRPGGPPPLLRVPMGLPDPPPPVTGHALRDRFAAIGPADPVVLWWGSVWRWLDAGTAIEAVGLLAQRRPDVRFVITAGKPPNVATDPLNATEEARELARRTGLLDRHVFFLDEWVPFESRHEFLADADVGLTLHGATPEATLAARARYMDYVWASLPSVLARGDEVADQLAAEGAARLVAPHDPGATAHALEALLTDRQALASAQQACQRLADGYRWDALLAPLVEAVEASHRAARPAGQVLRLAGETGGYYTGRAVDRFAAVLGG